VILLLLLGVIFYIWLIGQICLKSVIYLRVRTAAHRGQRQTVDVGCSRLACEPFVNVKINDMGNFLEQSKL